MSSIIDSSSVVKSQLRTDLPSFTAGSVVRVSYFIREGSKERIQSFEGLVIAIKNGSGLNATFTVLKNSTAGVKVFRIFPLHSPMIQSIEVKANQRGRRSRLYYSAKLKDPTKSIRTKSVKTKVQAS